MRNNDNKQKQNLCCFSKQMKKTPLFSVAITNANTKLICF